MEEQKERRRSTDTEIIKLQLEVVELKKDVEKLQKSVEDLVNAWNTAQGLTSFVKWASTVVIALGTLFAFLAPLFKK